jgi:hypothetical protein
MMILYPTLDPEVLASIGVCLMDFDLAVSRLDSVDLHVRLLVTHLNTQYLCITTLSRRVATGDHQVYGKNLPQHFGHFEALTQRELDRVGTNH